MASLKESIYSTISAIITTHHIKAPESATYPYCVYKLPYTVEFEERIDNVLEVDFWSYSEIDATIKSVDDALHRLLVNDSDINAKFYRESRLDLSDEEIHRIQIKYIVQTYLK